MNRAGALAAALLAATACPAWAQLNVSNILEARVGKDPNDPRPAVPDSRFTFFDQFQLDYYRDALQLGLRFEHFEASEDGNVGFDHFVRRYAAWSAHGYSGRVGNYEALFGRGVVLRAFELPGVVREEGFRQYGYSRDLDGVLAGYRRGRVALRALSGKPRRADEPPGAERHGLVSGAEGSFMVARGVRLGGEYLRLDPQDGGPSADVPGGFAQASFDTWLRELGLGSVSVGTYVEYARATGLDPADAISSKVDPHQGHGLYMAAELGFPAVLPDLRAAASWEYKDYQNFLLQGGVNEPPTLVREHTYALLNRSTHVLEPEQEEGYQLETLLDWKRQIEATLHWSRAENHASRRFREFYAEIAAHAWGGTWSLFGGDADDASALPPVYDRQTLGTYVLVPIRSRHSVEIELTRMQGVRDLSLDTAFEDRYLSLTYALAGRVSVTGIATSTNDPGDPGAGEPDPTTGEFPRHRFASVAGRFRLAGQHEIVGFWGRRRGGIACTAGTCYLVPAY